MIKQLRSRTVSIGEVNARKKNNMAGDNNGNNEKQYTNNDLMAILLGNQQTLATITTDVAKIQTDLSSVKLRQNELISQVDDVDARLESVERDCKWRRWLHQEQTRYNYEGFTYVVHKYHV